MKVLSRTAGAAALSLIVAGCQTPVPQVLTPRDVPPAFTGPLAPGAEVWPKTDWWGGFNSTELSQLVVTARTDNLDLALAMANVMQADANTDIQRAALFPQLTLSAGAARARTGAGSPSTLGIAAPTSFTSNSFSTSLNASYALDFWGLAQDNLQAADEALKSARYAQEVVALTITADTANTYLDILALREEIALTQKNIDAANRILVITKAKVTNGVSSQLDLAQQQATVAAQEALIPPLREQEREAVFALAILLGRPPEGFTVTAQNLDGIATPVVAPGMPSELLRRRPDVAEAEANLASAHANVDAARAAFFPQISLTGAGGASSSAIGTLFRASSWQWSIGADLLQTVFDGGKLIGESELTKAEQQGLVATYRKTVLTAFSNVEASLGQVTNFGDEQSALEREVKAASEAFRISELQYREGVTDLLAVLQSQQTLFTAQDQLVQVKLARIQAHVGLYMALGGGWSENPDDATQTTTPAAAVTTTPDAPAPTKS
jgi:multidrug efflux system outer membrane protein